MAIEDVLVKVVAETLEASQTFSFDSAMVFDERYGFGLTDNDMSELTDKVIAQIHGKRSPHTPISKQPYGVQIGAYQLAIGIKGRKYAVWKNDKSNNERTPNLVAEFVAALQYEITGSKKAIWDKHE